MESTGISVLQIRSGLPLQDRLPVWHDAKQLTLMVFNSQFLALNFASFVLLFCCSKANPAQQQSVSGRWLPAVHIWKISTRNAFGSFIRATLLETGVGSWKQYRRKFVSPELANQQQTHCSRNRNVDGGLQKESCPILHKKKRWFQQGQVAFITRITPTMKRISDLYLSISLYCPAQQARRSRTSSNQMAELGL